MIITFYKDEYYNFLDRARAYLLLNPKVLVKSIVPVFIHGSDESQVLAYALIDSDIKSISIFDKNMFKAYYDNKVEEVERTQEIVIATDLELERNDGFWDESFTRWMEYMQKVYVLQGKDEKRYVAGIDVKGHIHTIDFIHSDQSWEIRDMVGSVIRRAIADAYGSYERFLAFAYMEYKTLPVNIIVKSKEKTSSKNLPPQKVALKATMNNDDFVVFTK